MKALFEKIPLGPGESLACREFRTVRFTMPWHFHPECELTLIVRGRGMRYVGDSIARFADGDLVFLGPNLPHYWWKDADDRRTAHSIVIQFGKELFDVPEAAAIRQLIARSMRGVVLTGRLRQEVATGMKHLVSSQGWGRYCELLGLLGRIAGARPSQSLASAGFAPDLDAQDARRLTAVCRYVNDSFADQISQPHAASLAGFSAPAFSRFFHKRMGKTFEAYVTEVRVGHACRRLIEEDATVAEIAFASGFNNLSNFNRHFLALKGMTPRDYRGRHRVN